MTMPWSGNSKLYYLYLSTNIVHIENLKNTKPQVGEGVAQRPNATYVVYFAPAVYKGIEP